MRWIVLAAALAACGDDTTSPPDAEPIADADPNAPDAACGSHVTSHVTVPSAHVATCSDVTFSTNPPTSGDHYPQWAKFQAYPAPVPRGFSVHDLEHGAIVVSYNCPGGCDADVAAVIADLAARPRDPMCSAAVRNRFVVTPDPELDVMWAATAWGFALESDCLDLVALGKFIDDHYGEAPEDFCTDGVDPLTPTELCP